MTAILADDLVKAILNHVPFDGWSDAALMAGAAEVGLDEAEMRALLPAGVAGAIQHYLAMADADMLAAYQALDPQPQRMHEKIRALILLRLEQAVPHKETVRMTVNWLAKPAQAGAASRQLYRTVDTMWRTAGDEATDFSFYSKRATLAAVYSSTLLAFLGDDTPDLSKTTIFLDNRLGDVARIPKMTAPIRKISENMMRFGKGMSAGPFARR